MVEWHGTLDLNYRKVPDQSFVHLRLHTAYSLCEGAVKIADLVENCTKNDVPAVAITDTNNMFGVLEFSMKCSGHGIQPIIGTSIDLKFEDVIAPIVLLAKNESGYKNLLKLMTCFYIKNLEKPKFITIDNLLTHSEGIITLTGGVSGPAGKLILQGNQDGAVELLSCLNQIYADNLYVEISRTAEQGEYKTEEFFVNYAMENHIPLVATNEVFFLDKSMHVAHDVLTCIADGKYILEKDRKRVTDQHYMKSSAEMFELFSDLKEAVINTSIVAKRCSYMPSQKPPRLPKFTDGSGDNADEILIRQAMAGLKERLQNEVYDYKANLGRDKKEIEQEYIARLEYELDVIKTTGFSGYFLIVSDFVKWAKIQGIPVGPGRGSGAGSLVGWAIFITDLDPIRYHLFFERFLNPERVSMPDFDIDFCQYRRDEVIKYVQSKYGNDKVAHIIALGKLQARAVLRDVGRVIQMPYPLVDKISKLVPNNPTNPVDLTHALEIEPQLRQMMNEDESVAFLINVGLQLEGLYRHASLHAAGIVISDEPVDEVVPLYSDGESDLAITQFHMKFVEPAGLVKFDFLGLKTLTVIKNACEHIKQYRGIDLDILKIDLEDKKTFDLICSADVIGVFQLESTGMRDVIQNLLPDDIEDITALVSLYRPGPMDNIPLYIARKHGKEKVEYLHPILEPILKGTYGIMIYQEQVMKVAQEMGGYSLGSADLLRRAMGKKIKEEMAKHRVIFLEGAAKKGISKQVANQAFSLMEKFAGYGFNRAHAAGYAIISYQTAYLKANYRREFYIASMNMDIANTDKIASFVNDAKKSGIKILPPDINKSMENFIGEADDSIRFALGALKGCSVTIMKEITEEREKNGYYKDIFDFFRRTKFVKTSVRQVEVLILAGAFDSIHNNRRQIHDSLDDLLSQSWNTSVKQKSLFAEYKPDIIKLQDVNEWGVVEKLGYERAAVGFYLTEHPMNIYSDLLGKYHIVRSRDFSGNSASIIIAGILLSKKEKLSKNGQKYAFLSVSDQDKTFEVVAFPDVYSNVRDLLTAGTPLLIDANMKDENGNVKILANSIRNINSVISHQKVYLTIENNADIDELYTRLEQIEDGENAVSFLVTKHNGKRIEIETKYKKNMSIENRQRLENVHGIRFYS